jgi:hypothetical protein
MVRKKSHRKEENMIHDNRIVGEQVQAGAASALGDDSYVHVEVSWEPTTWLYNPARSMQAFALKLCVKS